MYLGFSYFFILLLTFFSSNFDHIFEIYPSVASVQVYRQARKHEIRGIVQHTVKPSKMDKKYLFLEWQYAEI